MKSYSALLLAALVTLFALPARAACTGTCSITNVGVTFTGGGMSAHGTLSADCNRIDYYVDGIATGNGINAPNYSTTINTFVTVGQGMHQVFGRATCAGGTVDSPVQNIFVTDSPMCTGSGFTCSLKNDGTSGVYCWGDNYIGQLGDGTTTQRLSPVSVTGISSARSVVCGDHFACALLTDGSVKCWGENFNGQLGIGVGPDDRTAYPVPRAVTGLGAGTTVSIGVGGAGTTVCAVTTSGAVKCWGANNGGQCGDGTSGNNRLTPVQVSGITSGATYATAGIPNGCAIVSGSLKCWGDNSAGEMGNGTTSSTPVTTPQAVLTGGVTWVSIGGGTIVAVQSGALKTWGNNAYGGVGDGTQTDRYTPVTIAASGAMNSSSGALGDACAVINHVPKCWGINASGNGGNGSTSPTFILSPSQVIGQSFGALAVGSTIWQACDIYGPGVTEAMYCWGDNSDGAIGDGTTTQRLNPVHVPGF